MNQPAGNATRKYPMYTAVSIKDDCRSDNWQAFFKCGIKMGLMLCKKAHIKNRLVIKAKATL
jgi:hypothetical protein